MGTRSTSDSLWRAAAIGIAVAGLVAGCSPRGAPNRVLTIALAVFPNEAERYRGVVRDFEAREHVRVQIIAETYGDILQALEVQARGGRGSLDLAELDLAMLGQAASDVEPLDRIVSPNAQKLFPDVAWRAGRVDAHLYFVPHRLMWQAMIYNRLMVPNPPATWDDLAVFVRAHPGKFALKAGRYEGLICDVMPFVWSAGGDECEPGAAGSLRALEFLDALAPSLNPLSPVFREMSVLEAQARGSVWIHFNWPFAIGYLQAKGLAPSVDLSAPLPAGPDGRATPLGGGYLGIPVSAPHPQLAAEFLRFLLTRATQERLSRALGWYGSIVPEPGSQEALLYIGYTAMRPYLRARPAVDCYMQLSNGWQRAVREVLFNRAPPSATLRELADGLSGKSGAASRCECGGRAR